MNHSESVRRNIRIILSGSLTAVLAVYLSAPRVLLETDANLVAAQFDELQAITKATLASGGQPTSADAQSFAPTGGSLNNSGVTDDLTLISWSVAGFPFDAIHIQSTNSSVRYHISKSSIGLNVLAFIVILSGVVGFAYLGQLHTRQRFRLSVAWLAVTLLFLSSCAWKVVHCNQQIWDLRHYGKVVQCESVEHPLFRILPASIRGPWTHCYSFHQRKPLGSGGNRHDLKTCLSAHPELQVIRLSEDLSSSLRNELCDLPLLHTLVCQKLSSLESLEFIAKNLSSLHSLKVSIATTVDRLERPHMHAIDFRSMAMIEHLSIEGIEQSDLSGDGFLAPRLKTLSIEFAGDDRSPLSIRDHGNLQDLRITSGRGVNTCFAIEIVDTPSLESLAIPGPRPVDLRIHRAPRLREIIAVNGSGFGSSNNAPWLRSLEIRDTASLSAINAVVDSPDSWIVQECPNLRSVSISHPFARWKNSLGIDRQGYDLTAIWDWMAGSLPLNEISLNRVDVRDVDFADWKASVFLESVSLMHCITKPGQLKQLARLESLDKIVAPDVLLDSVTATELLGSRNDWTTLELDWSQLESIRIVDQPKLVSAFGSRELRASKIRLENLPRFSGKLSIRGNPNVFRIRNVPQLSSLVVNGAIPQDGDFHELPNLRTFGVRRSTLSDQQVQLLYRSPLLQDLLLPRCTVPQDLVTGLSRWKHLVTVDLSLVRVNVEVDGKRVERFLCDEDTIDLPSSDSVVVLNLDGSEIGRETVARLTRCQSLQAISLFDCKVAGEQLLPLSLSDSLLELRVARSADLPAELDSVFEIDRSEQPHETFVSSWNLRAAARYPRRHRRGPRGFGPPSPMPAADGISSGSERLLPLTGRNRFGKQVANRELQSRLFDSAKVSAQ